MLRSDRDRARPMRPNGDRGVSGSSFCGRKRVSAAATSGSDFLRRRNDGQWSLRRLRDVVNTGRERAASTRGDDAPSDVLVWRTWSNCAVILDGAPRKGAASHTRNLTFMLHVAGGSGESGGGSVRSLKRADAT